MIDPVTKQCIDSIIELLAYENRREGENQGLYKKLELSGYFRGSAGK